MFDKIRENYSFLKENLNGVRFKLNWIFVPISICVMALDMLVCFLMFCFWKDSFLIPVILLLSLIVGLAITYIVLSIIVKKKEVKIEAEKLDMFFKSNLLEKPEFEYVLPRAGSTGVVKLIFGEEGFKIDNIDYKYDSFECGLYTSNYMYQVNLIAVFKRTEVEDKEDGEDVGVRQFSLPLNLNLLSIMSKFSIKLKNPDVLKFIQDNTQIASKQILKYGKIQNNYYNVK